MWYFPDWYRMALSLDEMHKLQKTHKIIRYCYYYLVISFCYYGICTFLLLCYCLCCYFGFHSICSLVSLSLSSLLFSIWPSEKYHTRLAILYGLDGWLNAELFPHVFRIRRIAYPWSVEHDLMQEHTSTISLSAGFLAFSLLIHTIHIKLGIIKTDDLTGWDCCKRLVATIAHTHTLTLHHDVHGLGENAHGLNVMEDGGQLLNTDERLEMTKNHSKIFGVYPRHTFTIPTPARKWWKNLYYDWDLVVCVRRKTEKEI